MHNFIKQPELYAPQTFNADPDNWTRHRDAKLSPIDYIRVSNSLSAKAKPHTPTNPLLLKSDHTPVTATAFIRRKTGATIKHMQWQPVSLHN